MADTKNLTGFKELAAALRALGPKVVRNGLRSAVSAGAAVVRNEARQRAPVDTGEMRRDIQIKRERDSQGGDSVSARYSVFVRSGKQSRLSGKGRNVQKDSFYWRYVEFGTSKMAAKPFLRPAFEAKKEAAVQAIGDRLGERIEAAAKELTK
jgi:HK97 gp10 family phage protein